MGDLPGGIPRPPHAYVPGQTPRHPEEWFEPLKAGLAQGVDLAKSRAWRAGLAYFHAGYFWECHEVLEAVWLRTAPQTPEREMAQAVIQLANARLKARMGKGNAVRRLCAMVRVHLEACAPQDCVLGLSLVEVRRWVAETKPTQ